MTGRLGKRLAAMAAASAEKIPAAAREIMHAGTQSLIDSGAADRALGVGDRWPEFELVDQNGAPISSAQVLLRGPAIFSFFRGHW